MEEPQTLEQPDEGEEAETQKPVMDREDDRNTESAKKKQRIEKKLLSLKQGWNNFIHNKFFCIAQADIAMSTHFWFIV